jgi:hypothetical protein
MNFPRMRFWFNRLTVTKPFRLLIGRKQHFFAEPMSGLVSLIKDESEHCRNLIPGQAWMGCRHHDACILNAFEWVHLCVTPSIR